MKKMHFFPTLAKKTSDQSNVKKNKNPQKNWDLVKIISTVLCCRVLELFRISV